MVDNDAPVRLVQVTDTHLGQQVGTTLLGLDTDHSLRQVLRRITLERPQIDLILATGDLSDHGSNAAYCRFAHYIQTLDTPYLWLPGNHDLPELMMQHLSGEGERPREHDIGRWRLFLLDSTTRGEVGGSLDAQQLAWLESRIAATDDRHILVAMHHQPLPVGCAWLDQQCIPQGEQLVAMVERYPQVRALLWGHVHQAFDQQRPSGLRLLASPSTCVQFAPQSDDFQVDSQPPGYRWLDLYPDGRIETAVSRVEDIPFQVDLGSTGY